MISIVLDTNVLVSAIFNPNGVPAQILEWVLNGEIGIIIDNRILSEYTSVLERPQFEFALPRTVAILDVISRYGKNVEGKPLTQQLPDSSDEPFLEVALSAQADYIITGNLRHFPAEKREGIKVVSPREFREKYVKDN